MTNKLTKLQTRHLRSLAHQLNFIVQTGEKGLTEAVLNEISIAIADHELIKIKLNAEREIRQEMIDIIMSTIKCELIQSIGKVIVVYKHNKNKPRIELPKK